jgi:hypothetical protein
MKLLRNGDTHTLGRQPTTADAIANSTAATHDMNRYAIEYNENKTDK